MQLTYRFRLYPSRVQEQELLAALGRCRWLYNHFLERLNRKENSKTPRRYELQATLPKLKRKYPELKQVHIKRERSGKWFACFSVEVEEAPKTKFSKPVGIDLGIEHYIADTNGNFVEHPHNIAKSEWKLKREQRRLSRKKKGSRNRAKQRIKLALVHERISNQRLDFLHKLSQRYVNSHDFIAVEDLSVKELIEMARNGKNRADAAWATFLHMLTYKAERAGRWVEKVEPRGTTDRCSGCCEVVEKPLWVRVHRCPKCGLELDRDLNAARNILRNGLKQVGWEPAEFTPVEIGPLPAGASSIVEAGSPVL